MLFFVDFLSFGGKAEGGIFTAPKSAGNHTKGGQINAQQAYVQIHSPTPPRHPIPNYFCAMNLSVLEQLFKSGSLGYRFLAIIAGS